MLTAADYQTPIGILHAVFDGYLLCSLVLSDSVETITADSPAAIALGTALDRYFAGDTRAFDGIPIHPKGTSFQMKVWNALREIPFGQVRSYGEIAAQIGQPGASRAVGSACNKNHILLIIPCHRVISANGLGGFEYGTEIKQQLLQLESVHLK